MSSLLYGDSPLACAWLASSLEKKLSKQQYLKTSVTSSAKAIEESTTISTFSVQSQTPEDKENHVTLRVSGQLLYGVVKIYSRKTRYLYDDVSMALLQLRSAFAVSKSLTVPLEDTIVSLESITMKDRITEANIIDTDFNLDEVFGGSSKNSQMRTWTQEDSQSDDYALGDISIGRGVDEDVGNVSIDALARRAEPELDDLDHVPEFELPLDFDKGIGPDIETVAGIANYNIEAADNMDLEFTIDETHMENEELQNKQTEMRSNNIFGNEGEEEEEERAILMKRPRRTYQRKSYDNLSVIRTNRKRLVIDETNEIATNVLKKSQRDFPPKPESKLQFNIQIVMENLNPEFLKRVGTSWMSVKRRKLREKTDSSYNETFADTPLYDENENEISGYEVPEFTINEPTEIEQEEEHASKGHVSDFETFSPGVSVPEEDEQEEEEPEEGEEEEPVELNERSDERTIQVASALRAKFADTQVSFVSFDNIPVELSKNTKSNATRTFFELLVLGTSDCLEK
ncbi:hypothetical protein CAS74_003904 [Pichia kudriavzevii]|uniref:Rad21/Rec8-like protein N-terminal domain-containing protein n=1 Tax=Pichia kudriavzevii TaxID=4909 RepID=A0A1Z8JK15_PICKU|nr:hypothetical protein CAS74_003904 [Pichia kudriavzevii]